MKQPTLEKLTQAVTDWGTERNFFASNGATYEGQWLKLLEETGELAMGIAKKKLPLIKDAIGDMLVVCIMLKNLADAKKKLTAIQNYNLYEQISPYQSNLPHVNMYFITSELNWLNSANTTTTYVGYYLQRLVKHLNNVAIEYGFTLEECLNFAYKEIKDRQGKMQNGVFIKQSDIES